MQRNLVKGEKLLDNKVNICGKIGRNYTIPDNEYESI